MMYSKMLVAASTVLTSLNLATAIPTSTAPNAYTAQPLATFDDIPVLNPTGPTNPVGVYRTLDFPGFAVGTFLPTSPVGVVPQSGTQFAVFNLETELLTLSPVSAITVQNDDSTTKSFQLGTFYYGIAAATQESLAGLPVAGSVVAKGYNAKGTLVAQQTFPYTFTADKQGMTLGKPSADFTDLYNVTFSLGGGLLSEAVVGLLDSVSLSTSTSS